MVRPRSIEAQEKVLKAVIDLIAENGIEGTSMDAVAEKSGVSKATVYKHWPSKDALCVDAIGRLYGQLPDIHSGDPRADITAYLQDLARTRKPGASGKLSRIWPRIVGYSVGNAAFRKALQGQMAEPRQVRIVGLLRDAIKSGELRKGLDMELAVDLLIGPIMHRRFSRGSVPSDVPERVVDAFWRAHSAVPARPKIALHKTSRQRQSRE